MSPPCVVVTCPWWICTSPTPRGLPATLIICISSYRLRESKALQETAFPFSLAENSTALFLCFPTWNHLLISRQLQACVSPIWRAALQVPLLHNPICLKQLVGLICDPAALGTELWRWRERLQVRVCLWALPQAKRKACSSAAAQCWVAFDCMWPACGVSLCAAAKAEGPENLFCCMMCHNWQEGIQSSSRMPILCHFFFTL